MSAYEVNEPFIVIKVKLGSSKAKGLLGVSTAVMGHTIYG